MLLMQRPARSFWLASGLVTVLALLAVVLLIWQLWSSQREERAIAIEQTERRASQLAGAVAGRIGALVRSIDIVLLELRREHRVDRFGAMAESLLKSIPEGLRVQIGVADPAGMFTYASPGIAGRVSIRDLEHFKVHADGGDRLYVGKPLLGGASDNWTIPFTRPILRNGRPAGVAMVSVSPHYIGQVLASLRMAPEDIVSLLDSDGTFLARGQRLNEMIGKTLPLARPFMRPDAPSRGGFRARASLDGTDRVFAWERIPDTSIFVNVGLDVDTALAPLERHFTRNWKDVGILSSGILALGIVVVTLLLRVARQQQAVATNEARFRQLTELSSDWYWEQDENFRLTFVSSGVRKSAGADANAYLGKARWELPALNLSADDWARHRGQLERHESFRNFELQRSDQEGRELWVSISGDPILDEAGHFNGYRGVGTDVTAKKLTERRAERSARFYRALVATKEMISRESTAEAVFAEVCRFGVEEGGLRLAWVGIADPAGRVVPAAGCGDTSGYTDSIVISTDASVPEGRGPTAIAVREGRTVVVNEFLGSAMTAPWAEQARRAGVRASAAIPLRSAGEVIGALNVYASEAGFFDSEMVALIERLAADVSFALDKYEAELQRSRAVEALRRNEGRLLQAARVTGLGIFDHDHRADTIYWSPEQRNIYGIGPDEAVTLQGFLDRLYPEDLERIGAAVRRAHDPKGDGLFDVEHRIVRSDGAIRWLTTRSQTLFEGDGDARRPVRTVGAVLDITERKQAEQALRLSEEQNRALIQAVPDLLFRISRDGVFLDYHSTDESILYAPPEAFLGRAVRNVLPPAIAEPAMQSIDQALRSKSLVTFEYQLKVGDAERIFENRTVPLSGDQALLVVRDITDRMRSEEAIHRLNEELEQRVAKRTSELEAANRQLESFSYSISHDLRAPLRAIAGFTDLLMQYAAPRLTAEQRALFERVAANVGKMNALIDDLLEFSRTSRSSVEATQFSLRALVDEVVREQRAAYPRAEVQIGALPQVTADRPMLRQVVVNLINNALKFSSKVERPRVEIGCSGHGRDAVYFVRDNGAGFDMRYADKLFGVFQRLHRADEFEGTGVGLAIVRQIIQRHGGRVWTESAPGRGATFFFTIPPAS